MNRLNIPGISNGIPLNWDDIEFFLGQGSYDAGIYQLLAAYFSAIDDNMIIDGCVQEVSSPYAITDGWVILDGELLRFDGGNGGPTNFYFNKTSTNNSDGNKQTQLSGTVDIYQENRAIVNTTTSNLLLSNTNRIDIKLRDLIEGTSGYVKHKRISIGTWDMSGGASQTVAHQFGSNWRNIAVTGIVIYNDDFLSGINTYQIPCQGTAGENPIWVDNINSTNIVLSLLSPGFFTNSNFNDVGSNRGYVYISYTE